MPPVNQLPFQSLMSSLKDVISNHRLFSQKIKELVTFSTKEGVDYNQIKESATNSKSSIKPLQKFQQKLSTILESLSCGSGSEHTPTPPEIRKTLQNEVLPNLKELTGSIAKVLSNIINLINVVANPGTSDVGARAIQDIETNLNNLKTLTGKMDEALTNAKQALKDINQTPQEVWGNKLETKNSSSCRGGTVLNLEPSSQTSSEKPSSTEQKRNIDLQYQPHLRQQLAFMLTRYLVGAKSSNTELLGRIKGVRSNIETNYAALKVIKKTFADNPMLKYDNKKAFDYYTKLAGQLNNQIINYKASLVNMNAGYSAAHRLIKSGKSVNIDTLNLTFLADITDPKHDKLMGTNNKYFSPKSRRTVNIAKGQESYIESAPIDNIFGKGFDTRGSKNSGINLLNIFEIILGGAAAGILRSLSPGH
jgi:hypothetical protein